MPHRLAWGRDGRGQLGDEPLRQAMQVGWAGAVRVGRPLVFARLMFDLVAWQHDGAGDTRLSALSPTLDVGVAPLGRGLCASVGASWDVRLGAPDRALIGAFVGLCHGGWR